MAKQTLATLKQWFVTHAKPIQQQFWDWMDSFRHKDDKIGMTDLTTEVQNKLNAVGTGSSVDISGKLDKAAVGAAGGAASLGSDGKVPASQLPALGTKGDDGQSAYQLWLAQGNTGDVAAFLASLHGTDGEDGNDGQSAYAIWQSLGNTGTEQEFLNSFKGADGKNAYEIAKTNGFTGSQSEWLASLVGKSAYDIWLSLGNTGTQNAFLNSLKGTDGQSAYAVAVANGFAGTQAQWLASLKGADGGSAYAVAVANGYKGTQTQWLASLQGSAGKSAYDIWLADNPGGTYEQYKASLKGDAGAAPILDQFVFVATKVRADPFTLTKTPKALGMGACTLNNDILNPYSFTDITFSANQVQLNRDLIVGKSYTLLISYTA